MLDALRRWRQRRFAARHPFPEADWRSAMARLPLLAGLDDQDARRLGERAWRFVHDKRLSLHPALAAKFELDAAERLVIAAQVCLLTLGWSERDHQDALSNVHELLILPEAFHRQVEEVDDYGVMHEYEHRRVGETSYQGPVVVAWPDLVASGGRNGFNVLIHEFAHKLDMGNSLDADGFPPLSADLDPREWHRVFTAVWGDLQAHLARGEATPIDAYAASHPGECFAVSCEIFFSAPEQLMAAYPALYDLLRRYFRQNPLQRYAQPSGLPTS